MSTEASFSAIPMRVRIELVGAAGLAALLAVQLQRAAAVPVRAEAVPQLGSGRSKLNSDLFSAAERGDSGAIRALLRKGASVRSRDEDGWTPLVRAASQVNLEACRVLLRAGADANARGKEGETALWAAAGGGKLELVRLLLSHGAKVNVKTKWDSSALEFASEVGHLDIVKLLVGRGADLEAQGEGAIGQAIFRGRTEVVRYLMQRGVSINKERWSTGSYPNDMDDGWSLLMVAIHREHTDIAALLIRAGADVRVKSRKGMTALKLAKREGYADIVKLLKGAGARQ